MAMDDAKNIIFLDFDGPICNHRASLSVGEDKHGSGMSYLDPIACGLIKRLCEEHNARIVVSSSWRVDFDLVTMTAVLGAACAGLDRYVYQDQQYWRTVPYTYFSPEELELSSDRGLEIKLWLKSNKFKYKGFVVIDDMSDMRPVQAQLVRVDPYEGFGFLNYMQAKKILGDDSGFVDRYMEWAMSTDL